MGTFLFAGAMSGCENQGCLGGEEGCVVDTPCGDLEFICDYGPAVAKVIRSMSDVPGGLQAEGTVGDILLANDRVQAIIEAVDHRHYLAPSGGNLIDLATTGDDNASLTHMFLATGILPGDAVYYEQIEILQTGPDVAAVQVQGRLDGHADARVYTRYEVRRCDPGVRIRTEIINLEDQPGLWPLYDTFFWAGKETQPFVPVREMGFDIPDLDLERIDDILFDYPFMAAASHGKDAASYCITGCNVSEIEGFNDDDVSAMGLARRITPPRDYRIYERFLAVAKGNDVAASADIISGAREVLFNEDYLTVSGRTVLPDGTPVGGNEARASVIISEQNGSELIPRSQDVPDSDGLFSMKVPTQRSYRLDIWAFGRPVTSRQLTAQENDVNTGDVQVPLAASLELTVRVDDRPREAMVYIHPADDVTRENVEGKLNGRFFECAPLIGAPYGPSPACNRILVYRGGPVRVEVPPGNYHIYATAGPYATLARKTVQLTGGSHEAVMLGLVRLPIKPRGCLSADLHVHCGRSFDSTFPERDRVISILAAGLDVVVSSDHDLTHDYRQAISELDAQNQFVLIPGTEATGYILFMDVPGSMIPKVPGHWIFFPLDYKPDEAHGGVPWTQLAEPGELFERMLPHFSATPVIQLNHPWEGDFAGRDQGWAKALSVKLNRPLPPGNDGTSMGLFSRVPECGPEQALGCTRVRTPNDGYNVQEVINGSTNDIFLQDREFWFYLLDQGIVRAGTANSDSHFLVKDMIGQPRNLVFTSTNVTGFNIDVFNQAVREGRMIGSNGPVLLVKTTDAQGQERGPSTNSFVPASNARLEIRVDAAPWVPVTEIRIYVNGGLKRTIMDGLVQPTDPFGTEGTLRYTGEIPLAELLPAGNRDAYVTVEAGLPLPLFADLNDDGIPDTGDNNGDGIVNLQDVDEDDRKGCRGEPDPSGPGSCGPLEGYPEPEDEIDPLYHFYAIIPDSYPIAFTNPLLLDRDSDGVFSGPGLESGGE